MVFEKIKEMIIAKLDCDPSEVAPETTFESLSIDSLDVTEMVMNLEDELGVTIELDGETPIKTVAELTAFIESKLA